MYTDSFVEEVEKKKQRIEKVNFIGNDAAKKISSLPSRMELHHSKKKKKKKLKFPLLKVLLTFFILLPLSTIVAYTYFSHHNTINVATSEKGGEEILYETINNHKGSKEVNEKHNIEQAKTSEENTETLETNVKKNEHSNSEIDHTTVSTNTDQKNNQLQGNNGQINDKANIQIVNHIVQPNETLFSIAMKYYHSQAGIEQIIEQNHIINNEIQVGQTLEIPLKK